MISSGVSILYSFFTNAKKLKERMPLPMSALVTEVSKTEFKPKQTFITFEICCNDTESESPLREDRISASMSLACPLTSPRFEPLVWTADDDVEVPYVRYKFRNF